MFKIDKSPLHIVVTDSRWEAYGAPLSYRQQMLLALLQGTGGISDTVSPGHYHYNAKLKGFNVIVTLEPVDE